LQPEAPSASRRIALVLFVVKHVPVLWEGLANEGSGTGFAPIGSIGLFIRIGACANGDDEDNADEAGRGIARR
jgi:hypothetical protein